MSTYNPFYDDMKERRGSYHNERHKTGTRGGRKCTLPSDNLTPAQQKKLNGPVKSYVKKYGLSLATYGGRRARYGRRARRGTRCGGPCDRGSRPCV